MMTNLLCQTLPLDTPATSDGPARGQESVRLSPARLEFALYPGAVQSAPLALSNHSDAAIHVRAELLEAQNPSSCLGWLTVNPAEIEVAAGKSVLVRCNLRVPADTAAGSFDCAVAFNSLQGNSLQGNSLQGVQMATALHVIVGHFVS